MEGMYIYVVMIGYILVCKEKFVAEGRKEIV